MSDPVITSINEECDVHGLVERIVLTPLGDGAFQVDTWTAEGPA